MTVLSSASVRSKLGSQGAPEAQSSAIDGEITQKFFFGESR